MVWATSDSQNNLGPFRDSFKLRIGLAGATDPTTDCVTNHLFFPAGTTGSPDLDEVLQQNTEVVYTLEYFHPTQSFSTCATPNPKEDLIRDLFVVFAGQDTPVTNPAVATFFACQPHAVSGLITYFTCSYDSSEFRDHASALNFNSTHDFLSTISFGSQDQSIHLAQHSHSEMNSSSESVSMSIQLTTNAPVMNSQETGQQTQDRITSLSILLALQLRHSTSFTIHQSRPSQEKRADLSQLKKPGTSSKCSSGMLGRQSLQPLSLVSNRLRKSQRVQPHMVVTELPWIGKITGMLLPRSKTMMGILTSASPG
jgi:hypothetical protein